MAPTPTAAPVLNIANALTMLRLALVPVFVVALFTDGGGSSTGRVVAFVVFAVAAATDRLDGQLARRMGLVTDFGKIADPIADKALTGAGLIGLSILAELPWWVTVVVIVRETGVTLLRFWVIRYGVIPAGRGGKVKTLLQTVAIGLYVLPLPPSGHVAAVAVMAAAVAMTMITGVDYVVQALRLRATGRRLAARAAAGPATDQVRRGTDPGADGVRPVGPGRTVRATPATDDEGNHHDAAAARRDR